jgi:GntR family transcriptional regulator
MWKTYVTDTSTLILLIRAELTLADPDAPLYRRLCTALAQVIASHGSDGGHTLPSERKLSETLGLSRVTVRRALEDLAREGRVRRRQGAQTRITDRVQKSLSKITGFSEELLA